MKIEKKEYTVNTEGRKPRPCWKIQVKGWKQITDKAIVLEATVADVDRAGVVDTPYKKETVFPLSQVVISESSIEVPNWLLEKNFEKLLLAEVQK